MLNRSRRLGGREGLGWLWCYRSLQLEVKRLDDQQLQRSNVGSLSLGSNIPNGSVEIKEGKKPSSEVSYLIKTSESNGKTKDEDK